VGGARFSGRPHPPNAVVRGLDIVHTGSDYTTFVAWLRAPLVATLVILLLIALFHHTALGLQVVIEDYIHSGAKFAAVIAVRLGCFALAIVGIVATLRIAFSG
jgi:succinate dehydrogenase / fumarate reductase membrane anchor subunit